jgi:hypothetical protein
VNKRKALMGDTCRLTARLLPRTLGRLCPQARKARPGGGNRWHRVFPRGLDAVGQGVGVTQRPAAGLRVSPRVENDRRGRSRLPISRISPAPWRLRVGSAMRRPASGGVATARDVLMTCGAASEVLGGRWSLQTQRRGWLWPASSCLGLFPAALRWTDLDRNHRGQPEELAMGYGVALTAPTLGTRLCRAHIGGCES